MLYYWTLEAQFLPWKEHIDLNDRYSTCLPSSFLTVFAPAFSPLLLFRFLNTTTAFWSCSWWEAEAEAAAEVQSWPEVPTLTDMERWKGRPRGTSLSDAGDSWCEASAGDMGKAVSVQCPLSIPSPAKAWHPGKLPWCEQGHIIIEPLTMKMMN